MQKKQIAAWLGVCCISMLTHATTPYGVNLSYLLIDKDPQYLRGYRFSFLYQPPTWMWNHIHIFWDFGFGHWWVNHNVPYGSLNSYAIAPVFRFFILNNNYVSPFVDISIGPSYLTKTRISDRNLGMHFSFQDQIGIGATFGAQKHFTASLSALHYSNGSLCAMNAGITVPLMLNLAYQF